MRKFTILTLLTMIVVSCKAREEGKTNLLVVDGKDLDESIPGYHTAVSLIAQTPDGKKERYCTGVVIDQDIVLTSANCQSGLLESYLTFADNNPSPDQLLEQNVTHRHPLFAGQYYFDVAWIRAQMPSIAKENFHPILTDTTPLLQPSQIQEAIVVGGGINGTTNKHQRLYTEVDVTAFIENDVGRAMIKAKSSNGSVCFGDNGGPLYVKVDNKWYLAGILHGYDYENKFDKRNTYTDGNENFPDNVELCKQNSELIFTHIGYHLAWIKSSTRADNPNSVQVRFRDTENYGLNFKAWCEGPQKSDLAWISTRLALDSLLANTCEEGLRKIVESKQLTLELSALAKANTTVIDALLTFSAEHVESLTMQQFYNDHHNMEHFLNSLSKFKKLKSLKIENYVGYQSWNFLKNLPESQRKQIETFHFLPAITPDYDNDGEGRRTIADTDTLGLLTGLKELHLAYNGIVDIRFIEKMPELQLLNLDYNNIVQYAPLLKLKNLKDISIVSNPLDTQKFISDFQSILPNVNYQVGNSP